MRTGCFPGAARLVARLTLSSEFQGTLRRLKPGREQRRRVLNDALLFATARKYGCAVLSRNVRDFDLLQQLDPSGKVVFYKIGAQ